MSKTTEQRMRNVRDPEAPDTVCDFCEGTGQVYAQNTAPIHVHQVALSFFQWPARPVDPEVGA